MKITSRYAVISGLLLTERHGVVNEIAAHPRLSLEGENIKAVWNRGWMMEKHRYYLSRPGPSDVQF
jgi:hypothetical protein